MYIFLFFLVTYIHFAWGMWAYDCLILLLSSPYTLPRLQEACVCVCVYVCVCVCMCVCYWVTSRLPNPRSRPYTTTITTTTTTTAKPKRGMSGGARRRAPQPTTPLFLCCGVVCGCGGREEGQEGRRARGRLPKSASRGRKVEGRVCNLLGTILLVCVLWWSMRSAT